MTSKADLALQHVQNLYLMQWKLLDLLEQDLRTPAERRKAREDVVEALKMIPNEMEVKLKKSSKR